MKKNRKKKWIAAGAASLLLLGLGGCLVYSARFGKLPAPATDESGAKKLPIVVLAVRGRVEVMDPGTHQWSSLRPGMVLQEGMVVNTGDAGNVTFFSSGTFSMTAGDKALFSIQRARTREGQVDVAIDLRSGRLASRVADLGGDSRFAISTDFGTYALNGGSNAITAGNSGDQVVVATGTVTADMSDGSSRALGPKSQVSLSPTGQGLLQQTELTGSTDGSQALAVHLNTVGNTTGEADSTTIDIDAEKRRVQDLIYWGMNQLSGRQFGDLASFLGNNFSLNGIPTSPDSFGPVVSSFNTDHQVLTNNPNPDVSVSMTTGTTGTAITDTSGSTSGSTTTTTPNTSTTGTSSTPTTSSGGTSSTSSSSTTPSGTSTTGTSSPSASTGGTTTTVISPNTSSLSATAVVTSALLAQTVPPSQPSTGTGTTPPPPVATCSWIGGVKYVFKLVYDNGVWKIVSLEVITNP